LHQKNPVNPAIEWPIGVSIIPSPSGYRLILSVL
jgi:hypothetical protein